MNLDDLVKKTIVLPKTKFPIKRSNEKDKEITSNWEENDIYKKSLLEKESGNFKIQDGPPYANGSIHVGHFVNRILKDFVLRFYNSIGFKTNFTLGWDTHGLPIEFKVLKEKENKSFSSSLELRKKCREYALNQINLQKEQLKKIGLLTDYNSNYSTQDLNYQSNELKVLAQISKKGLVYRGLKPVYWSWSNETALAENEVEYFEKEDHSLFFKVEISDFFLKYENVKMIVWTTQPWTIPLNRFIAVNPKEDYLLIKNNEELIVVSKEFAKKSEYFKGTFSIEESFKGEKLVNLNYFFPYVKKETKGFLIDGGDYVSIESGTGIVHIAPSCGPEDFAFAKKERIEKFDTLDEKGKMKEDFFIDELKGVFYQEINQWVINDLHKKLQLFDHKKIYHSYPHDWRDKTPLVYRLTDQWFINLSSLKEKIKENIEKVIWIPSHSKEKMISFIENREEWCISRQRSWGLPIPSILMNKNHLLLPEIIQYVAERVEKEGSDFWFSEEKIKEDLVSKFDFLKGEKFEIGKDTLDVWFDSGVSSFSTVKEDGFDWKSDLYLEGKDQFRGWFNSSLIVSTILKNEAPYKKVVSHGFVVDDIGRKMSKSLNNSININEMVEKFGIDILRFWVSSFDFSKEIKTSENIILKVKDSYQKIRNTLRFIIGNTKHSFNLIREEKNNSSYQFSELNNYTLSKLWSLALQSKEDFLNYKFSNIHNALSNFCTNDLSSFYFEIIKDILYCEDLNSNSRKETIIVMYSTLQIILKIISPILPFLAEEAYQEIRLGNEDFFKEESIHLVEFPNFIPFNSNNLKKREFEFENHVINLRKLVFQELEKAKKDKTIEFFSQAKVLINIKDVDHYNYLSSLKNLNSILIVAETHLIINNQFSIKIEKSENKKCKRCWRFEIKIDDQSSYCERCFLLIERINLMKD